jgi:hypothetical protein
MAVTNAVSDSENSTSNANSSFARGTTEFASITLPATAADAICFDFRGFSGGSIKLSGACTITWYGDTCSSRKALGTPVAAYDGSIPPVAIVQVIGAAGIYDLPPGLFGKAIIAPVASSGTPPTAVITLKK